VVLAPRASDIVVPAEYDTEDMFTFDEDLLLAVAVAVQVRSVNVVDIFGGDWTLDQVTESFVGLRQRATEHGPLVQLETLPWFGTSEACPTWLLRCQSGTPRWEHWELNVADIRRRDVAAVG
jgi:hypothetical protein